jgi:hypothetical protein
VLWGGQAGYGTDLTGRSAKRCFGDFLSNSDGAFEVRYFNHVNAEQLRRHRRERSIEDTDTARVECGKGTFDQGRLFSMSYIAPASSTVAADAEQSEIGAGRREGPGTLVNCAN